MKTLLLILLLMTTINANNIEKSKQDCDKSFDFACVELANIYYQGIGVQADYKQAFKYYLIVAREGWRSVQYNVGVMYDKGETGNSGGPLLDTSGNIIGVIYAKLAKRFSGENVNLAIKSNIAQMFLDINNINYTMDTSDTPKDLADIADSHAYEKTIHLSNSKRVTNWCTII